MRMTLVPTEEMCIGHICREHEALHNIDRIVSGRSFTELQSWLGTVQHVDFDRIQSRHDELAEAMPRRLGGHSTPLSFANDYGLDGSVNMMVAYDWLARHCAQCKSRIHPQ